MWVVYLGVFFFKQKTAYEMRISDWSSDVCSSDLKIAGIWINAASMRFRSAPSFYAIASPEPIGKLVDARTRAIYELGLDSLQLSPASTAPIAEQTRFAEGLVDVRHRAGLYVEEPEAVEITDGVL